MRDYTEYTVKIKDREQDVTHIVHEWALSQNEANSKALFALQKLLGHTQLEIV